MRVCCIYLCQGHEMGCTFFAVPEDDRYESWRSLLEQYGDPLMWLRRKNFICDLHFTREDFRTTNKRILLKHNAIPSVFENVLLSDSPEPSTPLSNANMPENTPSQNVLLRESSESSTPESNANMSNMSENTPSQNVLLRLLRESSESSQPPNFSQSSPPPNANMSENTPSQNGLLRDSSESSMPQSNANISENTPNQNVLLRESSEPSTPLSNANMSENTASQNVIFILSQPLLIISGHAPNQNSYCVDYQTIFKEECESFHYFQNNDQLRKDLYLMFSNTNNLSENCKKLLTEFSLYINKRIILMKAICKDLIQMTTDDTLLFIPKEYRDRKLKLLLFVKKSRPLFTELKLRSNLNNRTAVAYGEVKAQAIGYQHIIYTTQPGDPLASDSESDSSLPTPNKRKKTCQKPGDFDLGEHITNSCFDNSVKCRVEIFILILNPDYCRTLATHLGLIFFESLLEEEDNIPYRLANGEDKIYRVAHTEMIKLMMNGYSSICVTSSVAAWLKTSAYVKAIICTTAESPNVENLHKNANFVVFVENNILAFMEAIGQIVKESLHCNVLIEAKYQLAEHRFTRVHLPMTVLIPLYIVKYYTQSYLVSYERLLNNDPLAIFVPPIQV